MPPVGGLENAKGTDSSITIRKNTKIADFDGHFQLLRVVLEYIQVDAPFRKIATEWVMWYFLVFYSFFKEK